MQQVNKIDLDASRWTSILDFYEAVLSALDAPDWHDRNINALIDSIIGGGINAVEPPYSIVLHGTSSIDPSIVDHVKIVKNFLAETRDEVRRDRGKNVDASIEIAN